MSHSSRLAEPCLLRQPAPPILTLVSPFLQTTKSSSFIHRQILTTGYYMAGTRRCAGETMMNRQTRMTFAGLTELMGPGELKSLYSVNVLSIPPQTHLFTPHLVPQKTWEGSHSSELYLSDTQKAQCGSQQSNFTAWDRDIPQWSHKLGLYIPFPELNSHIIDKKNSFSPAYIVSIFYFLRYFFHCSLSSQVCQKALSNEKWMHNNVAAVNYHSN